MYEGVGKLGLGLRGGGRSGTRKVIAAEDPFYFSFSVRAPDLGFPVFAAPSLDLILFFR